MISIGFFTLIWDVATTPSTLTPTYEISRDVSPNVSRKNSRTVGISPTEEQQRDTIIRFQLESEVNNKFDCGSMKVDGGSAVTTPTGVSEGIAGDDIVKDGLSKLGRLYFKVR